MDQSSERQQVIVIVIERRNVSIYMDERIRTNIESPHNNDIED
jgi:hypothetical protein